MYYASEILACLMDGQGGSENFPAHQQSYPHPGVRVGIKVQPYAVAYGSTTTTSSSSKTA